MFKFGYPTGHSWAGKIPTLYSSRFRLGTDVTHR
jgi:hypothetical protein